MIFILRARNLATQYDKTASKRQLNEAKFLF